ncbi:hypothetical protein D7W79_40585 [Corallococcus exercitus]|nr:hypothetical protein D7W79_40585 [Corallococcus exercitus]
MPARACGRGGRDASLEVEVHSDDHRRLDGGGSPGDAAGDGWGPHGGRARAQERARRQRAVGEGKRGARGTARKGPVRPAGWGTRARVNA